MKQHSIFLSGFGALMILTRYAPPRPFAWRPLVSGLAVFAVGVVLPYAVTCLWLWWAGVFDQFWFRTVTCSQNYVSEYSIASAPGRFWKGFMDATGPNWPLWIAAALGAVLVRTEDARKGRWFLYAFSAFSFFCICPGFFFRNHYFIIFLPAVAIFGGIAGSWLIDSTGSWVESRGTSSGRERSFPWPAIVILVATGGFVVGQQWEFFLLWTPEQACWDLYDVNPCEESLVIGDYLRRHSTPEQRVAVLGSEPQVYFYAKRLSATGFIYTYELMEPTPFARRLQEEMCREIEATKPEFLVVVNIWLSWARRLNSDTFMFDRTDRYVKSFYRPVGLVDRISPKRTDYLWDDQAMEAHPRSSNFVWVFRRKK